MRTVNSHFVALMPTRRSPDRPGIRQFMVIPWREDRNKKDGETKQAQLIRVSEESFPAVYKFIGGTNNGHPEENEPPVTGSREGKEEGGFSLSHDDLREIAAYVHEVRKRNHTQYFVLINADPFWRLWEGDLRRIIKIDYANPPEDGRPPRNDEVLGPPVWMDEDYLLDGNMYPSHKEPLLVVIEWMNKQVGYR